MRLAVEVGTGEPRWAADGPGGPRLLAGPPPALAGTDELVLVHPPHWSAATARAGYAGTPARTRTCPTATAVTCWLASREPLPPGPLAVLEVGYERLRATVLAEVDGAILASRELTVPVERRAEPGWPASAVRLLDAAAADAGHPPPTLTGGVLVTGARAGTPELSERLLAVVGEPPRTPGAGAAVLGALRDPSPSRPVVVHRGAPVPEPPARALGAGLLPRPVRARRLGVVAAGTAAAAVVVLAAGPSTGALLSRTGSDAPSAEPVLAQYGYRMRLPAGWRHSGGLPERRRTLLTPAGTPLGADLVSVEQAPLGYDSAGERNRAHRELRERFLAASAADPALHGFSLSTRFGGRDVIAYQQAAPGAEVDWYVLFDGDAQLSVGCQHTPVGAAAVRAACAEVVASLARAEGI